MVLSTRCSLLQHRKALTSLSGILHSPLICVYYVSLPCSQLRLLLYPQSYQVEEPKAVSFPFWNRSGSFLMQHRDGMKIPLCLHSCNGWFSTAERLDFHIGLATQTRSHFSCNGAHASVVPATCEMDHVSRHPSFISKSDCRPGVLTLVQIPNKMVYHGLQSLQYRDRGLEFSTPTAI